jgi:hypothetical protein
MYLIQGDQNYPNLGKIPLFEDFSLIYKLSLIFPNSVKYNLFKKFRIFRLISLNC